MSSLIAAVPKSGATWKFLDGIAELVEAGRPEVLAQRILELKDDPRRCSELAAKGISFAASNLSPDVGRVRYLEWVKSLIASK